MAIKEDGNMLIARSCNDKEKQILLDFKANLVDINNNLEDWGNKEKDCCQWVGIDCNKKTGHVTILDLSAHSNGLSGNISSLLPLLSQLQYLDLSGIDFMLNPLPNSLSSLTNLRYLKISAANLSGSIPGQLANLSNLIQLDLNSNELSGLIPDQLANLSNLIELDLGINVLSGSIPVLFGDMASLGVLYLSRNQLEGVIPKSFGNMSSLTHLDLSNNLLNGSMPNFDGCLGLSKLDLSRNQLSGNLPISVGKLSKLDYLDVSSNSLDGLVSDVHFQDLILLNYLDLSFNFIKVDLSNAIKSYNLKAIKMQSCMLGPSFPMWFEDQADFEYLDISNAGISDEIPDWFWDLPRDLKFLNLSSNRIKGTLPPDAILMSVFNHYPGWDLSNNQFKGTIPVLPHKLAALNLSGNKFSGTLSFLCEIDMDLTLLDLSNNLLSGSLPDCWQKFGKKLVVLDLSNNKLSGEIPSSLGFLSHLQALYLRRNAFVGEVPMSLSNCTTLRFVDLGGNKLSGNIPSWIGETLSKLYVLVLQSNKLNGSIPSQICLLNNLQFLDLSNNGLSGNIPRCFGNFTAMASRGFQDAINTHSYSSYMGQGSFAPSPLQSNPPHTYVVLRNPDAYFCPGPGGEYITCDPDQEALFIDNILVAWKGTQREFGRGLYLLKVIDISSNKLCGKLPDEITNLLDLISLNVSINKLTGDIPKDMGRFRFLESLDMSRNDFTGLIPSSLSQLTSLSYLDLSYNSLSGRIPSGPQLQLFNSSSYTGNPQLWGPPLTPIHELPPPTATTIVVEKKDEFWKPHYTGISAGFVVGFWGICGALILNLRCRYLFFASLNNMKDWIYVSTVVHFRNLHTKFKRF